MFTEWRTSTYSSGGSLPQCVEIGIAPGRVGIRDSKNQENGHLDITRTAFQGLVSLAKSHTNT